MFHWMIVSQKGSPIVTNLCRRERKTRNGGFGPDSFALFPRTTHSPQDGCAEGRNPLSVLPSSISGIPRGCRAKSPPGYGVFHPHPRIKSGAGSISLPSREMEAVVPRMGVQRDEVLPRVWGCPPASSPTPKNGGQGVEPGLHGQIPMRLKGVSGTASSRQPNSDKEVK